MKRLNDEWTAQIVGRLHRCGITHKDFADRCGYTAGYLSMVLNGKKTFTSDYSEKRTRNHITQVLSEIEHEIFD